jgi:spore maturation protein CgeB
MKIVVFGLTITSAWGNGHATTYRSLLRALARRGHRIEFIEKDVEWYRGNRDLPQPDFCTVRLYEDWKLDGRALVRRCSDADAIVIGSYFPDAIAAAEKIFAAGYGPVVFYDIDTPITVGKLRRDGCAEYVNAELIPSFSAYLSFTGGPLLRELQTDFGAQQAFPLYCSVDPDLYRPSRARARYRCDLSYLGTYAEDRQPKLTALFNGAASQMPEAKFVVAGAMYPKHLAWGKNVRRITHVPPPDHAAFYSSSRFTLNLTRADMVQAGYSPSVRLFEASASGAAILSDDWPGLPEFLTPGAEVLLPANAEEVCRILRHMTDAERIHIGSRARERILAEHTSTHRAMEFEAIVSHCTVLTHYLSDSISPRECRQSSGRVSASCS